MGIMELRGTQSSNIAQVGYDQESNTLRIVFTNGSVYDYYEVDEQIYRHLLQAPSKGQFFHQYIRNNYTYQKTT